MQRMRLLTAMAEVMSEKGFVATSVEDVLKRAGVSRQTFYQLFSSKLDCFTAAFGVASDLLGRRMFDAAAGGADPLDRFERLAVAYLDALAAEPGYARLFLVEVYAAGPAAVRRRAQIQDALAGTLADLLEVRSDEGRFTCQMIVSATSAMVTGPVAAGDVAALNEVGPALMQHVRRLWDRGLLS